MPARVLQLERVFEYLAMPATRTAEPQMADETVVSDRSFMLEGYAPALNGAVPEGTEATDCPSHPTLCAQAHRKPNRGSKTQARQSFSDGVCRYG